MKVASVQVQANDLPGYERAAEKLITIIRQAAKTHDLVLVPECALPAYYIEKTEACLPLILEKSRSFLEEIKDIARKDQTYIACGYVEQEGDRLYNTALLIDRNGDELVKKRKSYLWHFDHLWFSEGEDLAMADTDFGRVGLVVCCDARSPEIVRLAALEGADLIIDLANLTATGQHIAGLHNAQSAYMLSVRALENRVWLVMSDKWGVEADTITFAGRSAVYGPDGTCHYQASSDSDEVVSVEIPLNDKGKIMRETTKPLPTRRPELYSLLVQPTSSLPISTVIEQQVSPAAITPYITTAAGELSAHDYITMVRRLGVHGSQLICMPPSRLAIEDVQHTVCAEISGETMVVATMTEKEASTSYIFNKKGLIATYKNAHKNGGKPFVLETPWGNIGIMHDEEGLIPEWARVLMLAGADCLIWPNRLLSSAVTPVARARAAENRMFVVVTQSETTPAMGQIIDPGGIVIASTLQEQTRQACGTYTCFANSRMKNLVPGTHVVYDRHPQAYSRLVRMND